MLTLWNESAHKTRKTPQNEMFEYLREMRYLLRIIDGPKGF